MARENQHGARERRDARISGRTGEVGGTGKVAGGRGDETIAPPQQGQVPGVKSAGWLTTTGADLGAAEVSRGAMMSTTRRGRRKTDTAPEGSWEKSSDCCLIGATMRQRGRVGSVDRHKHLQRDSMALTGKLLVLRVPSAVLNCSGSGTRRRRGGRVCEACGSRCGGRRHDGLFVFRPARLHPSTTALLHLLPSFRLSFQSLTGCL